jgi:hypothetical protein
MNKEKTLDEVLAGLMKRYSERVPDVKKILKAMVTEGLIPAEGAVENDHIAFRTMGVPHLGIASLEKIFLHYGYEKKEPYFFEQKKLKAFWYAPPKNNHPRVFVSELLVDLLSEKSQKIIRSYTDTVRADPVDAINLDDSNAVDNFLHSPLWRTPTWGDYQELLKESEYAAWVIYNRYYLNHFTISVHNLPPPWDVLEKYNDFLEKHGIVLNNAGGKIKTSPEGKLRQSSTVAQSIEAEFPDAGGKTSKHTIAGSYVEFAERSVLDEFKNLPPGEIKRIHRRDGFEAGNADKIFESTFTSQTNRKQ